MDWVEKRGSRLVRIWLFAVAGMIIAMVLLGGLTRLTDSGLSMVEWRLVMGVVPPLSQADWLAVFEKYQQFPQYQKHFPDMSMSEFKFIFMMEYTHRLIGRLMGLVFFLPFVYFLAKKWLRRPFIWRCSLLFFLGGLQGVVGWIMVKSGLVDLPRVDHLRLTLHLGLALFLLCLTLWYAYRLSFKLDSKDAPTVAAMGAWPSWLLALLSIQILSGGMVAGLRAGHAFNTWPTMNGAWFPAGLWSYDSFTQNFIENPVFVQFFHRWWAILVTVFTVTFVIKYWRSNQPKLLRHARVWLMSLLVIQVVLGIATLVMRVPISLASAHQLGAVFLLMVALLFCQQAFDARRINKGLAPGLGSV